MASMTLMTWRSSTPSFMYWFVSSNIVLTMRFFLGMSGVIGRFLSVLKSSVTKSKSSSPVRAVPLPSSWAQFRQR